jgi:hypothetical protein
MPEAVRILKDAGLGKDDAWKIFQQGWDYVNEDKRPGNLGDDVSAPARNFATITG